MRVSRLGLVGALLAVALQMAVEAVPTRAFPMPISAKGIGQAMDAVPIGYWRRGPSWGIGPGLGFVGGVIIGGALVANAIAEHRAEEAALHACARDFRGFDPRTGTFVDNYGQVRVCPYLR
jgi:BA14K-like protein